MIEIKNTEIFGWEAAIRGMRNPMNSWEKSDSHYEPVEHGNEFITDKYVIGTNDLSLMKKLVASGTDHRKFMRMITVQMDVLAPRYWWEQFATYRVGVTMNSCSTMHKIHTKEFTLDDFSHEHLKNFNGFKDTAHGHETALFENGFRMTIADLNTARKLYLQTGDKQYWWQMIQLLPQSYNQKRTVMLNYEVLLNIYKSRKNHKLDEWHTFCGWIESLPYMKELIQ